MPYSTWNFNLNSALPDDYTQTKLPAISTPARS